MCAVEDGGSESLPLSYLARVAAEEMLRKVERDRPWLVPEYRQALNDLIRQIEEQHIDDHKGS